MSTPSTPARPFALGRPMATPGAFAALERNGTSGLDLLQRHACGDWGEVEAEDAAANDQATVTGDRLLSAYTLVDGTRIWLITEADRRATTFLLPEEY